MKKNKEPGGAAALSGPAVQNRPVAGPPARTAAWASGSEFIKQADCQRCGAPKTLPSKTAYLYCDHCGALVDYDFRIANADSTAPSTNMVYRQLAAVLRPELREARLGQDRDRYRELQSQIFGEWIARFPAAVSPRAKSDEEFRARMVAYSCGGCGGELLTVVGARVVVCENCGRRIDVGGGNAPCQNCGAPLSFPESTFHLSCPYCHAETQRV